MTEQLDNPHPEKNLLRVAYTYPEVRYQLYTGRICLGRCMTFDLIFSGIGLQVLQQICGINTVMYYTPTILEIAGFVDKRQALFLSILPAFVNAVGTLIGMW